MARVLLCIIAMAFFTDRAPTRSGLPAMRLGAVTSRVVGIILIVALGAPAVVWAMPSIPHGMDRIGASCCGPKEAGATTDGATLEKTCCCSPSHAIPAIDSPPFTLSSHNDHLVPLPTRLFPRALRPLLDTSSTIVDASTRAPPPKISLFAHHTLLQI